jgi:hypothetical protein
MALLALIQDECQRLEYGAVRALVKPLRNTILQACWFEPCRLPDRPIASAARFL